MTPTINVAALPATNSGNTIQASSFSEDVPAGDGSMPSNSFSALFKQLIEKTAPQDATVQLIDISVEEKESIGGDDAVGALNALLPFLEAIGLTQEIAVEKKPIAEMTGVDATQTSDTLIALAGPITPPVISTANIAEENSIALPTVAGKEPSPVASPQGLASQISALQVSAPQVSAPQASVPQVAAQLNPVKIEVDRMGKTPMRPDQLTSGESVAPPTESFADQLESAVSSQAFSTKAEVAADGNKNGNQPNQVTTSNLNYSPAGGNQGNQAVEQAPKAMNITQPVGAAGWDHEIGQRIVWMVNRSEGKAELVLTPPQMGRVEVSVTVSGDQATASFASANPVVREALESALPRLREALAEAGIQLGQAQVGAENARHSAQQEKNPDKPAAHPETSDGNLSIMATSDHDSSILKLGRGLVDVFA